MTWQRYAYYIESPPYRISKHLVKDKWKYIAWRVWGKMAVQLGVFNSADEARACCDNSVKSRGRGPVIDASADGGSR